MHSRWGWFSTRPGLPSKVSGVQIPAPPPHWSLTAVLVYDILFLDGKPGTSYRTRSQAPRKRGFGLSFLEGKADARVGRKRRRWSRGAGVDGRIVVVAIVVVRDVAVDHLARAKKHGVGLEAHAHGCAVAVEVAIGINPVAF